MITRKEYMLQSLQAKLAYVELNRRITISGIGASYVLRLKHNGRIVHVNNDYRNSRWRLRRYFRLLNTDGDRIPLGSIRTDFPDNWSAEVIVRQIAHSGYGSPPSVITTVYGEPRMHIPSARLLELMASMPDICISKHDNFSSLALTMEAENCSVDIPDNKAKYIKHKSGMTYPKHR